MDLMRIPASGNYGPPRVCVPLGETATQRLYSIGSIRQQMLELEEQLHAGMISDETYDHLEERLLQRLLEARQHQRQKQAQPLQ